MLEIGVFAPHGTDHDRNLAFCQDTDVHHIILGTAAIAGKDTNGVPPADTLKDLARTYTAGGVTLAALTPPRISQEALSDPDVRTTEMDMMTRILQGMGEAGIPFLHLYLNTAPYPSDPDEKARLWDGTVSIYKELTGLGEKVGVQVSTHHYHRPDRLLWNYDTMARLFDEVGSSANGVTFCQGKSELAGENLSETILKYRDRVFMVHIRDIVTRVSDPVPEETRKRLADYGYLEVAFGTGEAYGEHRPFLVAAGDVHHAVRRHR